MTSYVMGLEGTLLKYFSQDRMKRRIVWPNKGTGGLQHYYSFLMENSILKIFGSVDVKITPDFFFYGKLKIFFLMENSILKIFASMDVKITTDFCS